MSIFNVTPSGLKRGDLSRPFHKGQAVILNGDERIFRLFRSALDWLGLNHGDATDQSPFEMNLLDLAEIIRKEICRRAICYVSCQVPLAILLENLWCVLALSTNLLRLSLMHSIWGIDEFRCLTTY